MKQWCSGLCAWWQRFPARQNGDFGRNFAYFPLIFRLTFRRSCLTGLWPLQLTLKSNHGGSRLHFKEMIGRLNSWMLSVCTRHWPDLKSWCVANCYSCCHAAVIRTRLLSFPFQTSPGPPITCLNNWRGERPGAVPFWKTSSEAQTKFLSHRLFLDVVFLDPHTQIRRQWVNSIQQYAGTE